MDLSDKNRVAEFFYKSSSEDEDYVADAYLNADNESELKEIAWEHWEKSASTKIELQHILNHIHFHINNNTSSRPVLIRILSAYYRVAAILLIPILIGGICLFVANLEMKGAYSEIRAPQGSRVQFTLPDGSKGSLNGGSEIKYSIDFSKNRKVALNGEGYFEVTKDKQHPFVVHTKYVDVKVFGTKFNVCAYDSDQNVYTTLEEGSVQIFDKCSKSSVMLNPGEQNIVNTEDGYMKNIRVKTDLFTSWKDNMLRFDNETFDEVVKKMERWYGVKIILDKSLRYSENYTFTVKTESLKELLQLLSMTTPMNFTIRNDTVMINELKPNKMN